MSNNKTANCKYRPTIVPSVCLRLAVIRILSLSGPIYAPFSPEKQGSSLRTLFGYLLQTALLS